ncbi:hypothetical protein OG21DRAFT_942537 [Imleria badia]|nr:hypothetical protein OG21DRAFT_942537 [Imleria badia]
MNNIPVRIITKELEYRIGQRGSGVWPRTFEVFHFLRAFQTHQSAIPSLERSRLFSYNEPTPSIPYASVPQPFRDDVSLCTFCRITRSSSVNQCWKAFCDLTLKSMVVPSNWEQKSYRLKTIESAYSQENSATFEASYLIGADGAKVTRKQLGLSFLCETKPDFWSVVGDICLDIEGVDRKIF